jgi:hypothetical protein
VGEIGISRHEFLYELTWWEINSIKRGYRKRNRFTHRLLAECVYATVFSNRDPKGKTVQDMFPILFDDDDEEKGPTASISDEDREDLLDLMHSLNNNKKE